MGLAVWGFAYRSMMKQLALRVGEEVLACEQGKHVGLWEHWPDVMVASAWNFQG